MWQKFNNNPCNRNVGDCAVRAVAKALNVDWETAFVTLAYNALQMCDMPSSDSVWGAVLRQSGFFRSAVPNSCPECFTAADFCREYPQGVYVLGFGGHVATIVDGVLTVIDELLTALQGMIPRLYAGVIGKLQDID